MTAAVRTPNDTITIGAYNKPAWEAALDALDESREIDWFGDKYEGKDKSGKPTGNPAVIYRRENRRGEGQPSIPVWIKQYQCNTQYDLRPFNKWEADLLERVKSAKPYVYQLIHYNQATSYLRRKNDARTVGSSSLTTSSKGASIKSWLNWPVQEGGRHYTHAFLPPGNYLRFAKAALTALNALHDCGGLVHCDLNVGNWCLRPKEAVLITGPDERIRLIIDWNHLSIIDVGYSIHPAITPRVTMPLDTNMVSPHLSQALKKVDTEGSAAYWRAPIAQQTWRSFHDASLDPEFWANHAPYVLNALREVDWREDYWKLGRLLQGLRGDHQSKSSTPLRVNISTAREVNLLIGQAVETDDNGAISPAYGLAEDLIAWGSACTPYDTAELSDHARLEAAIALRRITHKALMDRLDVAISQLKQEDDVTTVFLYRRDIDSEFAAVQAARQTQEAIDKARQKAELEQTRQSQLTADRVAQRLADDERRRERAAQAEVVRLAEQSRQFKLAAEEKAARLADETRLRKVEAQRQRRERYARWLAKARARAIATAADVAPKAMGIAVLIGVLIAWDHWGKPVWRDEAKPALLTWYDGAAARGRAAWHVATTPLTSTDPANSTLPAAAPAQADRTAARTAAQTANDAAKNAAKKTAQATPVTAAMAAADAAATSQQRAAAYATTTAQIVASPWWLKGRSQGIAANAEQIAWASATVQHAQKDQWMLAQYALGALHCSAAQPNLARHSSADCGRWLGVALANPAYGQDPVASQKLRVVVTTLFDDMVIGMANGKFHKHAPDYAFARALLPGLQARQADTPSLALRAAYAMACAAKPAQRTQAMQTLQGVAQQRAAAPAETAQASRWLSEWQAGDYSVCAPAKIKTTWSPPA